MGQCTGWTSLRAGIQWMVADGQERRSHWHIQSHRKVTSRKAPCPSTTGPASTKGSFTRSM